MVSRVDSANKPHRQRQIEQRFARDRSGNMSPIALIAFVVVLQWTGVPVDAAQCCLRYIDALGAEHDAQFCADYCCGHQSLKLFCCSQSVLMAPAEARTGNCTSWWQQNIWAPIVMGVVCLAILVFCCVCCYRCCCRSRNNPVIIANPAQSGMSTTVVNATNVMATNTGNVV